MTHDFSAEDERFRADFETFAFPPHDFDHRAHVRIAYVYLCEQAPAEAYIRFREVLVGYLSHHKVDASKYHETITKAWILAVRHFMARTLNTVSSTEFIEANPRILDPGIMMTHYSRGVLFSDEAKWTFVEPDIEPIPRYDDGLTPECQ